MSSKAVPIVGGSSYWGWDGCGSGCLESGKNCNGRALDRVAQQKHRPNRQKLCKKCPKIVFSAPRDIFWTFFGHFSTIFGYLLTFCFSWLSNGLPVARQEEGVCAYLPVRWESSMWDIPGRPKS